MESVFGVINIAGFIIGIFALIVGMFSVANIMFVSVKERTSIIGIKKPSAPKDLSSSWGFDRIHHPLSYYWWTGRFWALCLLLSNHFIRHSIHHGHLLPICRSEYFFIHLCGHSCRASFPPSGHRAWSSGAIKVDPFSYSNIKSIIYADIYFLMYDMKYWKSKGTAGGFSA